MRTGKGTCRTVEELVAGQLAKKYVGKWTAPCWFPSLETAQGNPFPVYQHGVFMAEVEVDTAAGKTKVLKMTSCADVGTICSQLAVDGQMCGGIAQGIGYALSEDFEDIKTHSTMSGAGFPFIKDIPDNIELHYQQTPRPLGPFGAGGCGELPNTSPHAAIINAIYNACGVRIKRLPAYPEKVLKGLTTKE
jgi:aldehyde oxidoreductase